MRPFHLSVAGKTLAVFCTLWLIAIGVCTSAMAQRSPNQPDSPRGNRGGGGGGLPNAGKLFLQLAPGLLKKYGNDDDEPRRVRRPPNRAVIDDDDDDDEGRRPAKKKKTTRPRQPPTTVDKKDPSPPPRRVTVIPPLPVLAPERLAPPPPRPPTALSVAPFPLRREAPGAERPDQRPDEIVVMVRGAEPDTVAAQLAQGFNLVLQETLTFALLGSSRVYRFTVPDNRPVETLLPAMASFPGVGFAVPNAYYWLQGSAAAKQSYDLQYALTKMRVPAARAEVSGRGMTIAVIDSGVDAEHPSLKDTNLILYDATERGVKGPDMHGTAITGIIAASGDMVGIAPEARIIAVRAFAPDKLGMPPLTTATTLARAVDVAFSRGARIFNMSFAGRREPLLIEIIDAAYEQGAVFVAAAGNEGPDAPPAYPAAHDKVIAITATDQADEIYGSANRGGYVLAAAPGVDILAPVTGHGFDYLSGTSFAAAHVTGVIALLMERNPQLTAAQVRRILVDAAHDLGDKGQDQHFGAGLTDAYGALLLAGDP